MSYQPFAIDDATDLESLRIAIGQNLIAIANEINQPDLRGSSVLSTVPARPHEGDTAYFAAGVIGVPAGLGQYKSGAWVLL